MPDDQIQRELEYRATTLDDLGRLSALYERCFGRKAGERYFRWKYCENPAGPVVGFEAVHRDRTVASYAIIPEPYVVNGQPALAWQSMDTMTDPDYQRRGLFVSLAKRTYDHLATIDPEFLLFGVPGEMSYRGFIDKLGWSTVGTYSAMFTHRAAVQLAQRRTRAKIALERHHEPGPALTDYLHHLRPRSAISTRFTPEFFDWRVFGNITKHLMVHIIREGGEAKGLCVSGRDDRGWVVLQLLDFIDQNDYRRLLPAALAQLLDAHAASKVYVLEPRDSIARDGLRHAGFIVNNQKKGPMRYRQPIIALSRTASFHGLDPNDEKNYDFQQLMQD